MDHRAGQSLVCGQRNLSGCRIARRPGRTADDCSVGGMAFDKSISPANLEFRADGVLHGIWLTSGLAGRKAAASPSRFSHLALLSSLSFKGGPANGTSGGRYPLIASRISLRVRKCSSEGTCQTRVLASSPVDAM